MEQSGRENIIARLDGDVPPEQGGRVLLLDAHQDTVGTDGMTIPPFVPTERDGRIYGRGSCDVKGGMATILAVVARLAKERPRGMPTVLVSCTADEEDGFAGATRLTEQWNALGLPKPDAAIVLEPTELNVIVAHKGMVRWKIQAIGRAAHSSRPASGENAIYKLAKAVTAIEQYAEVLAHGPSDPYCGPATVSVGTIHGGAGVNTVADRCTIEIDFRPLPSDDLLAARQRLLDYLVAANVPQVEHDPPYNQGFALADERNHALAEQLAAVVRQVVGDCNIEGMTCCTNGPFFAALGVPTVVFGPGSLMQAHAAEEWISVAQLHQAVEVLYQFCL